MTATITRRNSIAVAIASDASLTGSSAKSSGWKNACTGVQRYWMTRTGSGSAAAVPDGADWTKYGSPKPSSGPPRNGERVPVVLPEFDGPLTRGQGEPDDAAKAAGEESPPALAERAGDDRGTEDDADRDRQLREFEATA